MHGGAREVMDAFLHDSMVEDMQRTCGESGCPNWRYQTTFFSTKYNNHPFFLNGVASLFGVKNILYIQEG